MTKGKRITISIPYELSQRLEAVKDGFNVSAVCKDALQQEVARQEFKSQKIKQPPLQKREFKPDKEFQNILKGIKDKKERESIQKSAKRYWEWERSPEGIAYSLDGQGVSDELFSHIIHTLCRLPDEVREFVYENCRFSTIANTAVYRKAEDVKKAPWMILLSEYDLCEDYQSIIARTIAHAYLDYRFPDTGFGWEIEQALEYEKKACELVKKWGFVGSGTEVDQGLIKAVSDIKRQK